MMRLDFLGPITPSCTWTGAKYMLIAVDYFSQFNWVRLYRTADGKSVVSFFNNFIIPHFRVPFSLYTDNGSYFTGEPAAIYFKTKEIQYFMAPVSYPSLVGLVERIVQLVSSRLRAYCIDHRQAGIDVWGSAANHIMQLINTYLIKIHGFTPAELMFRYRPVLD
jgi:hypothetical protein